MQILRRIIFYIFLIAYLVSCPLIVLYALGYIFNPKDKEIVQTGLVYLSTTPARASIYLGKSHYAKDTPSVIRDLLPGDYPVRLALKGYKPWENTVTIKAGQATTLDKILLMPEKWNERELLADAFRLLVPLSGTDFIILAKSMKAGDYYVYNCKTGDSFPLIEADSPLREAKVLSQFIVDDSPQFIINIEFKGKKIFILIRLKEAEIETEDITDLLYEPPLSIQWDPSDSRYLFSLHGQKLNRIDAESKTVYPNYAQDVKGYAVNKNQIYILNNDYALFKSRVDKNDMELFRDDVILRKLLSAERDNYRIKVLSDENSLFLSRDGELLTNLAPYLLSEDGVEGLEFFKKSRSLLFWSRNKIGVVNFSLQDDDTPRKKINLQWLYAKGARITQCFWVHEDSHIIFRDRDLVSLAELSEDGLGRLDNLIKLKENTLFYYNESTGKVYYLQASTGKFCAIDIVAKNEVSLSPLSGSDESNVGKEGRGL